MPLLPPLVRRALRDMGSLVRLFQDVVVPNAKVVLSLPGHPALPVLTEKGAGHGGITYQEQVSLGFDVGALAVVFTDREYALAVETSHQERAVLQAGLQSGIQHLDQQSWRHTGQTVVDLHANG